MTSIYYIHHNKKYFQTQLLERKERRSINKISKFNHNLNITSNYNIIEYN